MPFVEHKVRIHLDTYIGHPYWPEREKLINIQKDIRSVPGPHRPDLRCPEASGQSIN